MGDPCAILNNPHLPKELSNNSVKADSSERKHFRCLSPTVHPATASSTAPDVPGVAAGHITVHIDDNESSKGQPGSTGQLSSH